MKYYWRHILFFLFLLMFFIAAPVLILYTAGFRYHVGTNQILKTGLLNITSLPRNATLFIDGKQQDDRTPSVVDNIFAGSHTLRLEKDGYTAWNKTLTIKSRESTFVDNAVLFLLEETQLLKTRKGFSATASPTSAEIAILNREGSSVEVSLLHAENETLALRLAERSAAEYSATWSPDGLYLVIREALASSTNLFFVERSSLELTKLTLSANETYSWSLSHDSHIYIHEPDALSLFDLETRSREQLGALQSVAPQNQGQYQVQNVNERTVVSFVNNEGVAKIITYLPFSSYRISEQHGSQLLLQDVERDRIVLIQTNDLQHPVLLNSQALHWKWSEDGDLLFSDGFSIQTFNPETRISETVTRLGQQIKQVAWYPAGHVILYRTDLGVFSIGQDQRGSQNQNNLVEMEVVSFALDKRGKELLLFGTLDETQGLYLRTLQK